MALPKLYHQKLYFQKFPIKLWRGYNNPAYYDWSKLKASPWSWMNLTIFPRTPYSDTTHGSVSDLEVALLLFSNILHSRDGTGALCDGFGRLERPIELKNSFSWILTLSVSIKVREDRLIIKNKRLRITQGIFNVSSRVKQSSRHRQSLLNSRWSASDDQPGEWGWTAVRGLVETDHWYANVGSNHWYANEWQLAFDLYRGPDWYNVTQCYIVPYICFIINELFYFIFLIQKQR